MNKMQKINQKKLADYSKALSEKLTNEFFILNQQITGEQILKFTALEQVNLFIIKNLFDKWKEENSKLKSPYFDYENEEVKEALNTLLVKLSQHISVKKDHFIQLLDKAIYDTFSILLEPVFFLSNEYLIGDRIVISELKERGKYIRINKGYFKKLIEKFEGENKLYISKTEAELFLGSVSTMDMVNETDKDSCLQTFSSMLRIELNDLLIKPIISEPVKEQVIRKEEPVIMEEAPIVRKEEPGIKKEEPIVAKKVPSTEGMINEKFTTEFVTLNDKLKHEEGETLIQKHSKRKIADIKEAITLNQKFIFIKELMNGDALEYNNMLSAIDQCDNYQAALHLLNNTYSSKWNWVPDKTEVKEFYSIVERKYN
jgi:hypothetical protein